MRSSSACRWSLLPAAALAIALLALAVVTAAKAANATAAHGKRALYVYNDSKLEKAKAADPVDPIRIAKLVTWRDNDEKAMAYIRSLGFVVTAADEASALGATQNQDLVIISESVDAIDVGTKYRYVSIPLLTFENDLLGELGMSGLKKWPRLWYRR